MNNYQQFIADKGRILKSPGVDPDIADMSQLFDHQKAITRWALRKGRAAIFADTGLGKTRMQLVWADTIAKTKNLDVIILAPLAVAEQTVREGAQIGITVTHAREESDIRPGINITNYDRAHKFDMSRFGAVVLDESSIIKHHDAKTFTALTEAFAYTTYKLCATATPAPNDWTELGTHAEFLGICSRSEMLSEYFIHDGGQTQVWRLKGHARALYWRWVAGWGAMVGKPSDLGYSDDAYNLPPLIVDQITVESDAMPPEGQLFAVDANTLSERRTARRNSMQYRVDACANMANAFKEPWVIWCELNAEGEALRRAIPDAIEIKGADTIEHKEKSLTAFAAGQIRVLITKPKIAGFGLNWQHCARVGFVGVTDSWEAYYQAVRRCWRFGQKKEVHAHLFASREEGPIRENLARKEKAAAAMAEELTAETAFAVRDEILGNPRQTNIYSPKQELLLPAWMECA